MNNETFATDNQGANTVEEYTEKLEQQKREYNKKFSSHFGSPSNCEEMDRPNSVYDLYIEREGLIFELVRVEPNKSNTCPNKHNGHTAIYKVVEGAINYDEKAIL